MNKSQSLFWPVLLFSLATTSSAAVTPEMAETFLKIMSKGVRTAATTSPKEVTLLERTPAFIKAAETLGRNTTEAERVRVSKLLEQVLFAEYKKQGISLAAACEACLSRTFADDINGRAIDLIKKHDDLLVEISAQPDQILRLVDKDGKPIPSQVEYQQVINEMITIFSPSMSAAKNERTAASFTKKFNQALKTNGSAEIEYDSKGNALTATFKYGWAKVKVANIDVDKMLVKAKYFLYGGGLASLGYKAKSKESEAKATPLISKIDSDRLELLHKLTTVERKELVEAADVEYFVLKVQKRATSGK